jgi:hypothetical protein
LGYCTVDDIRAQGIPEAEYDDAWVQGRIDDASRAIDDFCGWWFESRTMESGGALGAMKCSGRGTRVLHLVVPIISIDEVRYVYRGTDPVTTEVVPLTNFLVHDGVLAPDDRWNPKLERFAGSVWPKGSKNIEIDGDFGFLEVDPESGELATPRAIARACAELAIANLAQLGDEDSLAERQLGALTSITRADRAESYSPQAVGKSSTGVPSVDRVLLRYRRRMMMGVL